MSWLYIFVISLLTVDLILAAGGYIGVRFVRPRWPEWWERHIVAEDPADNVPFSEQDGVVTKSDSRPQLIGAIRSAT